LTPREHLDFRTDEIENARDVIGASSAEDRPGGDLEKGLVPIPSALQARSVGLPAGAPSRCAGRRERAALSWRQ
jgi:hypothetical protein